MADLKISQLPALGDNLATADKIAVVDGSASETKSLTIANLFSANSFNLLGSNAIPIAKVSVTAGSIAGTAIADLGISTAKVANDAITAAKLDNNSSAQIVTSLPGSGGFTGQIAANSNDGYAASIWDGSAWQSIKAAASINTINGDTSSIVNIAVATSGSTRTISASIDDGSAASQFLASPTSGAGAVSLRAITGADLPLATSTAQGTIKINGEGLRIDTGVIEIDNDVTASSAYNLVTVTAKGLVSAYRTITAADLPAGTTSAKGALQVGTGLAVSSGVISVDNTATAGTYTKVTITASGLVSSGASLADSDLPNHSAALLTSGTLAAARIGTDTVDGSKLSNSSTTIFQSIAQQGFPTAQFNGQLCFDTVAEDAYIWDGTAWQAITTLTKGSLVYGGTYNATTSKVVAPTAAGIAAGLVTGSNLPSASSTTDGLYVVVSVGGTPSGIGITTALNPPDYILGVTSSSSSGGSSWQEIDLSATVSGQIAQNVGFTPFSGLSSTNCQDALEELETEKLAKSGGTVTGEILIGNAGSLVFEGATADAFETTIGVVDPTTADKTINFPDQSGTVLVSGGASIVNADVATNAALAYSKLAALASGSILVGNGSNVATVQAVSGDATLSNAGVLTIAASAITNAKISSSAAIALSKLATGALPTAITIANSNVASDAAIAGSKISPDFGTQAITTTGNLTLNNQADLRLGDSDGSHYVAIQAGATVGTSYTIELPTTVGATGKVLKSTVSGQVATLTWEDDASNTAASALTGNTLASGVTASSLTSVGTLSGLVVDGDVTFTGASSNVVWDKSDGALEFADNAKATFGNGDLQIYHNGSNSYIDNSTGLLYLRGADTYISNANGTENIARFSSNGGVDLNYANDRKFLTLTNGVQIESATGDTYLNVKAVEDSSSADARVRVFTTNTSAVAAIVFGDTSDTDRGWVKYQNSDDSMILRTNAVDALTLDSSQNATFAGQVTCSKLNFNNTALIASESSNTNIDHIWHSDGNNAWNFCSDTAYQATGNSKLICGSVEDSKGDLRSIPQQNEQGSAHTLVAADAGKHILADATVTAPPTSGIFSAGDAITIINTSGSDISIARGSGVTMYNAADGTNADRTLGTKGMATILCAGSNTYYISGAGLS